MAEKGKGKAWLPAVGNGRQKATSPSHSPDPDPDPAQLEVVFRSALVEMRPCRHSGRGRQYEAEISQDLPSPEKGFSGGPPARRVAEDGRA